MTFSIVARSTDGESWGVAVASKFLAVGAVVPAAVAGVGAVATQADANVAYKGLTLAHLDEGATASVALQRLLEEDEGRDERQVGIVDGAGHSATFTGKACHEWAGGRTGECYAAQGNILVSAATVDALSVTFESNAHLELGQRLIECLAAAQAAGGDRRGQQSASLLVVEKDAGYAKLSDTVIDLRVDDHERPIAELRRLFSLHEELFGATPQEDWLDVDDALGQELRVRLESLGHTGDLQQAFDDWAGAANLEERVDGVTRIDPIVLDALRNASS